MPYKWIPSRSKIENWILSKFIQILTIVQIFILAFGLLILINNDGPYITNRIPVLVPFSFISIGLVSCILMKKVTLKYWKWKEEKIGRFLFRLCSFISVVSSLIFCIKNHNLRSLSVLKKPLLTQFGINRVLLSPSTFWNGSYQLIFCQYIISSFWTRLFLTSHSFFFFFKFWTTWTLE